MNIVGIVGGLGPETTAEFYLGTISRHKKFNDFCYPRIIIDSVPVPSAVEERMILEGVGFDDYEPLLVKSALTLQAAGCDFLVMPCNTLHVLYDNIQTQLRIPLLNILSITASECAIHGYSRVTVLGTRRTILSRLYEPDLDKINIKSIPLKADEIDTLSALIYTLLKHGGSVESKNALLRIINNVAHRGADSIILGCTDLQLILKPGDPESPIPVVDSVDSLIDATVLKINQ